MPIMDGWETARILKERMKSGAIPKIPVIACTAFALQQEIERCYGAGMDDVITKPINFRFLEKVIDKWVHDQSRDPKATSASEAELKYCNRL